MVSAYIWASERGAYPSCVQDTGDIANLVIKIGDVLYLGVGSIKQHQSFQSLEDVLIICCMGPVSVPLRGFQFELIVVDVVNVVVV